MGYGFLISFVDYDHPSYTCKDNKGNTLSTGDIEIASTEWISWDGKVPTNFKGKWLDINNNAYGKKDYIPQVIIKIQTSPNPQYDEYLKALESSNEEEMSDEEAADMLMEAQMLDPNYEP